MLDFVSFFSGLFWWADERASSTFMGYRWDVQRKFGNSTSISSNFHLFLSEVLPCLPVWQFFTTITYWGYGWGYGSNKVAGSQDIPSDLIITALSRSVGKERCWCWPSRTCLRLIICWEVKWGQTWWSSPNRLGLSGCLRTGIYNSNNNNNDNSNNIYIHIYIYI